MTALHGLHGVHADAHPDLVRLAGREPSPLANALANVIHPLVMGAVMVVAVSLHSCWPRVALGLGWCAVALLTAVGLPVAVLFGALRLGWVSDLNVVRQDERVKPLCLGMAVVALAIGLCWLVGVPHEVVALLVAMLATVAVLTAITLWEKVSFHAAGAAAAMTVTGIGVSRWGWWLGAAALVAVGWARVRSGRHSLPQVLLGAVVGAAVVGSVFAALLGAWT